MAKEYIEREALLADLVKRYCEPCEAEGRDHNRVGCLTCWVDYMMGEIVDATFAADVVEVSVRCKDCKYGWKCCSGKIACQRDGRVAYEMLFEPTSYCSYGERMDNNAAD